MKITKHVWIALLAFVVGVVGLILCLTPGTTAPDKTVARYVAAINSGDIEKMNKYMLTASDVLGDYGDALGGLDDLMGSISGGAQEVLGNEVYAALSASVLNAADRLPEGVTEVKKVELCGCVDSEIQTFMQLSGLEVEAVLKVTYVDAEGAEQSFYSTESLGLVKYDGGYKIAG